MLVFSVKSNSINKKNQLNQHKNRKKRGIILMLNT